LGLLALILFSFLSSLFLEIVLTETRKINSTLKYVGAECNEDVKKKEKQDKKESKEEIKSCYF
jgi:hypothetical protein